MHKVFFRFYEELNDFLPEEKRKTRFEHTYLNRASVKDMIESIGVPHTEIDLILVNGISVGFNYIVQPNDEISVYPVFESFDISEVQHLRALPLRDPKFVLDVHLGTLARYLRMFGIDSSYKNDFKKDEMVNISLNEKRTILSKDRNLLKRNEITHGYWIRNDYPVNQVKEVIERFHLQIFINEFTRCLECNSLLTAVNKSKIEGELPLKVKERQNEFYRCTGCNKIYWKGSHYEKMEKLISQIKN
ncbi:MAG: twitching motility protein PilT [Ignavibacteriales bacterium]|nr:MAG: twitching motility protein PilT [Ignavibacteriales bacterium]